MASKQASVDFAIEQMADARDVSVRKCSANTPSIFGPDGGSPNLCPDAALYCDFAGKVVALFCDDQLFVKPTAAGKAFIGKVREGSPHPRAKPWFLIEGDRCEDAEWLSELARTERALPSPKPKKEATAKANARTKKKVGRRAAK